MINISEAIYQENGIDKAFCVFPEIMDFENSIKNPRKYLKNYVIKL